ncbi:MAG: hypothetical protein M3Q98_01890 [Actinomycetota bacterium]|nr:hypothetical protein [Actinomycetota bacterium]
MFAEFHGLPIHALVIHAAVVFAPLAAVLGFGLFLPRWRMAVRWPLVALAALAFATVSVAVTSGRVLRRALGDQLTGKDNPAGKLVEHHKVLGERLWWVLLAYLLVVIAVALMLPRLVNPHAAQAVAALVAVIAVVAIVLVAQTGEAGSKARWNPDGSFDYSGD